LPLKSPLSAPCRRVRKRERCGDCLSEAQRSEFRRAPLPGPAARGPRAAGRDHRGRLFLVLLLAEQKKNPAAGPGPGLVDWKDEGFAVSGNASMSSRRVA
jgi:hypothetical protein